LNNCRIAELKIKASIKFDMVNAKWYKRHSQAKNNLSLEMVNAGTLKAVFLKMVNMVTLKAVFFEMVNAVTLKAVFLVMVNACKGF
jgi:hypothetical protein